jgi:hypothetical protein
LAELPDEVLDRLSGAGLVTLTAWAGEEPRRLKVPIAPLSKQLYVLVAPEGPVEQALLQDGTIELWGEGGQGEQSWSVLVKGRGVPGRRAISESRRSELAHWLPDGVLASSVVAVRILPESVDYGKGTGSTRKRAAGPVPGGARLPERHRWFRLATTGSLVWLPLVGVINFVGLLVFAPPELRSLLMLGVMVASSGLLYCGVGWLGQYGLFMRWREGIGTEELVSVMLEGLEPAERVFKAGLGAFLVGAAFAGLLAATAGWEIFLTIFLASGSWLLGPATILRYTLRRTDAEVEG